MAQHTYRVGQPVIIVSRQNRGETIDDAVVEKIGRKWISVKRDWAEYKFDFDGVEGDQIGWKSRLWPDRATYETDLERRRLWSEFQEVVYRQRSAPERLTDQQIADMIAAVKAA